MLINFYKVGEVSPATFDIPGEVKVQMKEEERNEAAIEEEWFPCEKCLNIDKYSSK